MGSKKVYARYLDETMAWHIFEDDGLSAKALTIGDDTEAEAWTTYERNKMEAELFSKGVPFIPGRKHKEWQIHAAQRKTAMAVQ